MSWIEQEHQSRKKLTVTDEKQALLDKVKAETLPTIRQEASKGDKSVAPIRFQEVKSPGLFEAEFGLKEDDLIFHFWPWGLHIAERNGQPRPAFMPGFREALLAAVTATYSAGVDLQEDRDMGAFSVRVLGAGKKQFWYDLALRTVKDVHKRLGGD